MASYTINLTSGPTFATLAEGTLNQDSSMTLVGKNYAGYGEFLNENFVRLLESNANSAAPSVTTVLRGQLWYDTGSATEPNSLKVYTGTKWQRLSAITSSASQPSSNQTGDMWWDTTNGQLKAYNGSAFVIIGPAAASGLGNTGATPASISDGSNSHVVIEMIVNGDVVGVISKDSAFTPNPAIGGGFSAGAQIKPGITLAPNAISGQTMKFQGTATDSDKLGGVSYTGYLTNTTNQTTTGTLGILNNNGLSVGVNSDLNFAIDGSSSAANIYNQTNNANINIQINKSTTKTTAIAIQGTTGNVSLYGPLIVNTGNAATAIYNGGGNLSGNIGTSTNRFNTVYAQSTSALYADVAERFHADETMEPGTVVELGGIAEITKSLEDLSENVFGVISTRAAYIMNDGAGDNSTHPPIAMTGRVPVRISGKVNKGDRLVSAGNGLARKALKGEATAFNVIGRALESKDTDDIGLIEAIVSITK